MQNHLLAAAVLATLLVSGASDFAFYKLSLIWPTSACNIGIECRSDIPSIFTIHGLWPQFANDIAVPPYNKDTNKCTNVTPTSPDDILVQLQPIEDKLKLNWPNLRNQDDSQFWKVEWKNHGMCSDYPDQPRDFFNAGLTLATRYNPLQVMGIKPGDESLYEVKTILEAVKKNVGAYPQIACNILPEVKTLQLWEIRFCFDRATPPSVLRDCPNKLAGTCTQETDEIRFPPPPPV
ncbi:hypothetical protein CRYUN_Cryun05aG0120000 [Craigia yunnanensis]